MKRQNIRTLSLVIITLTYLIVGAAVFDYFESSNEIRENAELTRNITLFKAKHNMNDSEFNILWEKILDRKPYRAGAQWRFIGSLYFCTVVVTLIGYGHSTPRTIPGKCFCIFYTLIGIPIALIMFQSVGERLNSLIAYVLGKIKKKMNLKNQDVGLFELITVETVLTMTITCFASYIFTVYEGWSYFDAMYYCFITLTTIGFGDMVPMQKNNVLSTNFGYACFTIFFILTGLITLASSMNLLVLRLATINAEEQVQEKLEAAEARRQAVHVEGDVITPNVRLFVKEEKPEQLETISVCSCACMDYKVWNCKRSKKSKRSKRNSSHDDNRHEVSSNNDSNEETTNSNSPGFFSRFRKSKPVKRLFSNKSNSNVNINSTGTSTNTTSGKNDSSKKSKLFSIRKLRKSKNVNESEFDDDLNDDNDMTSDNQFSNTNYARPNNEKVQRYNLKYPEEISSSNLNSSTPLSNRRYINTDSSSNNKNDNRVFANEQQEDVGDLSSSGYLNTLSNEFQKRNSI